MSTVMPFLPPLPPSTGAPSGEGLGDLSPGLPFSSDSPSHFGEELPSPDLISLPANKDHDRNLALEMDEDDLREIARTVEEWVEDDIESRREWAEREALGIKILGISENVEPGADFEGSSTFTHPGLMEAMIHFHARSMAELWPAGGPAKGVLLGDPFPGAAEQVQRVEDYLNYVYTQEMPNGFDQMDRTLFRVGFSGTVFRKIYRCPLLKTKMARFCPPEKVIVPYGATDLLTTPRITHEYELNHDDFVRLVTQGVYRDTRTPTLSLENPSSAYNGEDPIREPGDERLHSAYPEVRDEIEDTEGSHKTSTQGNSHVIRETVCRLRLPVTDTLSSPFEDLSALSLSSLSSQSPSSEEKEAIDNKEKALPCMVVMEVDSNEVLAIYHWWDVDDPDRKPRQQFVKYGFLPGFGFYDLGLLHIAGYLSRGETGTVRAILDSAQLANLQGGFMSSDVQIDKESASRPIFPGEFRKVRVTSEELSKAFFRLPYQEPSPTLLKMVEYLDGVFRRLVGTTEDLVGDNTRNVPVGTTLARIEQGLKPQVAIHRRLHASLAQELKLMSALCAKDKEPFYPYNVTGVSRYIKTTDFDDRVDVVPVSDPNIVTNVQRLALAQEVVQLAKEAPQIVDPRKAYARLLDAMKVPQSKELLVPEEQPPAYTDPVSENLLLMTGKPVKAYPTQNHVAHRQVHAAIQDAVQKELQPALLAHIAEHDAMDYYLKMTNAMGMNLPNPLMGELPQLPPEVESNIALAAAQAAQTITLQPPAETRTPLDKEVEARIRREDLAAAANMRRDDIKAVATMNRKTAENEVDLIKSYLSREGEQALRTPKPAGQPE